MTIKFPQYGYVVKVIVTDDIMKSYNKVFKKNSKASNDMYDGLHQAKGNTSYIFFKPDYDAGLVAHESYHAVIAMLKWMGVEEFDEEIVAYNLHYLVSKIKLP